MERTILLMLQILCISIASSCTPPPHSVPIGGALSGPPAPPGRGRRGLNIHERFTFAGDWQCLNIDFGYENCADVLNSSKLNRNFTKKNTCFRVSIKI